MLYPAKKKGRLVEVPRLEHGPAKQLQVAAVRDADLGHGDGKTVSPTSEYLVDLLRRIAFMPFHSSAAGVATKWQGATSLGRMRTPANMMDWLR